MRSLFLLMTLGLPQLVAADEAVTSAPRFACESRSPTFEVRAVTCSWQAAGNPERLRFMARFGGGHDDTMASMALVVNGAPLVCEPGSKTRLMGEDGDVSLFCDFSIAAAPEAKHVLQATISFTHAQYTDFILVPR